MSLPAYAEYKDSGVEWLGDVPKHWWVKKSSYLVKAEKGKNAAELTKDYCGLNTGSYPVYSGQTENDGIMGLIDSYEFNFSETGVIFSTTVGAKAMTLSLLTNKFSLSQNCMIFFPVVDLLNVNFAYFAYQPIFLYERSLIPEHMQASFRMEDLYRFKIPVPPLSEQTTIARFLDHETAKIDSLIAEQQRLIELLKEKRQAVISHAVTKGLDPNAPMKDSGVEWLGDVPEHWVVGTLKNLLKIRSGQDYKSVETTDETAIPVIGSGGQFTYATDFLYEGKSVLLGRKGTIDKPLYIDGRFWTVDTMFYTEILETVNPKYVYWLSLTIPFGFYSTSTALPSMSQFDLSNHKVAYPKLFEQVLITDFLDQQTAKIDELISNAHQGIDLLKERRSALISAAVTGKIDVRGWQVPQKNLVEEVQ